MGEDGRVFLRGITSRTCGLKELRRRQLDGHGHQNEAAFYILEGAGYEIHDGQRYDWSAGDTLYVPTNTVGQHFADEGAPLRLVSGQNRLFKLLGYDNVVYLQEVPHGPAAAAGDHLEGSPVRARLVGE
jgi:Cupin domain